MIIFFKYEKSLFKYLNIVRKNDAKKVTTIVKKTIIAPIATPGPA